MSAFAENSRIFLNLMKCMSTGWVFENPVQLLAVLIRFCAYAVYICAHVFDPYVPLRACSVCPYVYKKCAYVFARVRTSSYTHGCVRVCKGVCMRAKICGACGGLSTGTYTEAYVGVHN